MSRNHPQHYELRRQDSYNTDTVSRLMSVFSSNGSENCIVSFLLNFRSKTAIWLSPNHRFTHCWLLNRRFSSHKPAAHTPNQSVNWDVSSLMVGVFLNSDSEPEPIKTPFKQATDGQLIFCDHNFSILLIRGWKAFFHASSLSMLLFEIARVRLCRPLGCF